MVSSLCFPYLGLLGVIAGDNPLTTGFEWLNSTRSDDQFHYFSLLPAEADTPSSSLIGRDFKDATAGAQASVPSVA